MSFFFWPVNRTQNQDSQTWNMWLVEWGLCYFFGGVILLFLWAKVIFIFTYVMHLLGEMPFQVNTVIDQIINLCTQHLQVYLQFDSTSANFCILLLLNCQENSEETHISQKHALVRGDKGHGRAGCRKPYLALPTLAQMSLIFLRMKMEKGTLPNTYLSYLGKGQEWQRPRKPLMMFTSGALIQERGWIWCQDGLMQGHQHAAGLLGDWNGRLDLKRQFILPAVRFWQPQIHPLALSQQ